MLTLKSRIVYEEIKDGQTGGGGSNESTTQKSNQATESQGDFDEFGYPKVSKQSTPPPPPKSQETKTTEQVSETKTEADRKLEVGYEAPPADPNAQYAKEPTADDKIPTDAPEVKEESKDKFQIIELKDLNETDKKMFTEYFEKHKLPKEAQESLVNIRKAQIADQIRSQKEQQLAIEKQAAKIKTDWYNELRSDKDFGGSNFDSNVKLVNKFITDHLPNTKKMLTEKGGMLPPSTMRDFYSVAKRLYETESFVQGDPGASETKQPEKWKFLSDLYPSNV